MNTRRAFVMKLAFLLAAGVQFLPKGVKKALADASRKILPKSTLATTLYDRNPKYLDVKNLETTSLKLFATMGETMHETDINAWRLTVDGKVNKAMQISYGDLLAMETFEKRVLLICPGVFSYLGNWKGISLKDLVLAAKPDPKASTVVIHGPDELWEKVAHFDMFEVMSGKVFLAVGVNGVPLPQKHGYPVRVVAKDRFGDDWIKYVMRVEIA